MVCARWGSGVPAPKLCRVSATANRRVRIWLAAGVAAALATLAVAAVTFQSAGRAALMAGLQRRALTAPAVRAVPVPAAAPAAEAVPAAQGRAVLVLGRARYALALSPNRASVPNRLTLTASAGARPLAARSITISFSMPAMRMFNAFTVTLHRAGPGVYAATMPFVGMSGQWRLDVTVDRSAQPPAAFAVTDRFGA